MERYFARDALLPGGWAKDVLVSVEDGDIVSVETGASGLPPLAGPVLPGMANLHSHAFQRAMAGLTEVAAGEDDFWSWRELMYRFAERLTPASYTWTTAPAPPVTLGNPLAAELANSSGSLNSVLFVGSQGSCGAFPALAPTAAVLTLSNTWRTAAAPGG